MNLVKLTPSNMFVSSKLAAFVAFVELNFIISGGQSERFFFLWQSPRSSHGNVESIGMSSGCFALFLQNGGVTQIYLIYQWGITPEKEDRILHERILRRLLLLPLRPISKVLTSSSPSSCCCCCCLWCPPRPWTQFGLIWTKFNPQEDPHV